MNNHPGNCTNSACVHGYVKLDPVDPRSEPEWEVCLSCNRDHQFPLRDDLHPSVVVVKQSANDYQPEGNHYRAVPGEQHWDRQWRLRGRGWFVGNITKYAERYDQKNGMRDLVKLRHYVEKLIELEQAAADGTGPPPGNGKPLRPDQMEKEKS